MLPVVSTRNTPPLLEVLEDDELEVELLLDELEDVLEVLDELDELEVLPPEEPVDELLEELLEELEDVLDDELEEELLDELEDELLEELGQLLITPPLPDWLLQVVRPIQLWLFSQPQPLS